MIKLASKDTCTACGACAYRCPHQCISMQENTIGEIYPIIDNDKCIQCHACEKICPVLSPPKLSLPQKTYAAWSLDNSTRQTSASGGIAYELYQFALSKGYKVIGASINPDKSVSLKIANSKEDIIPFKNSKYVFSSCYDVFPKIKEELFKESKLLIIGMSCQIAAMRKLYGEKNDIIYVEILCHGMSPTSYLQQHIALIEQQKNQKAFSLSFRAPEAYTYSYTFTLYDETGHCFYAAKTSDGDTYQYGYHRGVTYRENCYHCPFAQKERAGDIILCDFYGLGRKIPFTHDKREVSCIIVNTKKGRTVIDELISSGMIYAEERPLEEAIDGNPRLQRPSEKTKDRLMFEKRIMQYHGDCEQAIAPLCVSYMKELNTPKWKLHLKGIINRIKAFQ